MKLCIRPHDVGLSTADDLGAKIHAMGFDGVQLAIAKAIKGQNGEPETLTPDICREIREGFNSHGVEIPLLGAYFNPVHSNKEYVRKGAAKPETNFAGMVLDYRVNGKYAKRVALSTGLYHTKYANPDPPHWGTGGKPDAVLELGDFINGPDERVFSLDLEKLAPKDWDGTLFLSIGTARVMPNRRNHGCVWA